jgi:hypothetical protein
VSHAFRDGIARAVSAPAVLAGTIAVVAWLKGPADTRNVIAGLLLWAFLSGGILDRYARNRATRGRGFFGASGAHFMAMLRLGFAIAVVNAAVHYVLAPRVSNPYVMAVGIVLLTALALIAVYSQIRIVVEDRRSALGAVLGAARFIRRNPAAIVLYVLFAALLWAATWTLSAISPEAPGPWSAALMTTLHTAVVSFLTLALYASGVALFQSRLAHASYTAAPPIEWPDSPAAEAITNRIPGTAP